jgi:hypothetical protein
MNKTRLLILLLCLGAGVLGGSMLIWGRIAIAAALFFAVLIAPKQIGASGIWAFFLGFFVGGNINKLISWEWTLVACVVLGAVFHYVKYYRLLTPEQRRA